MPRLFKGNKPRAEDGWRLVYTLSNEEAQWLVYYRDFEDGWTGIKMISDRAVIDKANYWLAWSNTEYRLAHSHDLNTLVAGRPDLYDQINAFCQLGAHDGD